MRPRSPGRAAAAASSFDCVARAMLERTDMHALDVGEFADAIGRAFATVTRMLDPAERHARVRADVFVDEAQARLELGRGDAPAAIDIAGQNPRSQAELAGVGDANGVGFIVRGDDRGDRTE